MRKFLIKRLLTLIPMLLGVSFVAFILMTLCPGDFLSQMKANPELSAEYIQEMEMKFGLNRPWFIQYLKWLMCILHLDFGYSWTYHLPVLGLVSQRLLATLALAVLSLLLAWCVALPMGTLSAVYRNSWFDRIVSGSSYCFLSIPEFFLALLAVFFAAKTGYLPTSGRTAIVHDFLPPLGKLWDYMVHLILPAFVLGVSNVAGLLRLTRGYVLDFLNAEFVTTVRAKGLSEKSIIFKHVLRNALNPLVTNFGFALAGLLSGSLLIENIFNYPGLGQLLFEAFMTQDQYVVMASVVVGCVMLMLGNLFADVLLAWVDPRVRLGSKTNE